MILDSNGSNRIALGLVEQTDASSLATLRPICAVQAKTPAGKLPRSDSLRLWPCACRKEGREDNNRPAPTALKGLRELLLAREWKLLLQEQLWMCVALGWQSIGSSWAHDACFHWSRLAQQMVGQQPMGAILLLQQSVVRQTLGADQPTWKWHGPSLVAICHSNLRKTSEMGLAQKRVTRNETGIGHFQPRQAKQ